MTALNFALHDDCVLITTDSLGSGDDHVPRSFHTKVFPLPHVNGVICGTGALPLVLDWFVFVQLQLVAREVGFLSECAAEKLPEMAVRVEATYGSHGDSTIYHFGWDSELRHFRGFAHRSTSRFAIEEFERPRWALKPGNDNLFALLGQLIEQAGSISQGFVNIVNAQQAEDLALPLEQRVGIGGEVHLLHLNEHEQFLWNCYRFEDYDATFQAMLARLRLENSTHD